MKMLSVGNPKTQKGESLGYLTGILHLAPANLSGYQVCPMASAGCSAACLNTAGRGRMAKIQTARIRKTRQWFEQRDDFKALIVKDIEALIRKAARENLIPAVRLNGTSDIPWEKQWPEIFTMFSHIQFYDYTKRPGRYDLPSNYHLTFSLSEDNDKTAKQEIANGRNVAVVFKNVPDTFWNVPVINGDEHDLRFLDDENVVVGLTAKGKAKLDTTGFVR